MRHRIRPPVMPNFDPAMMLQRMGQWFVQYWFAPCSWQGSSQFTDHTVLFQPAGKGVLRIDATWRSNGQCTSVEERIFPTKIPGVYKHIDNIGNVLSGEYQILANDFSCLSLGWCCTRFSAMGNTCEDPWLSVNTRMPKADPKCLQKIDYALANILGIRLGDLQRIPHEQSCFVPTFLPKKGML